jgi:uncharacterized coiled-coil DUF342 family protein
MSDIELCEAEDTIRELRAEVERLRIERDNFQAGLVTAVQENERLREGRDTMGDLWAREREARGKVEAKIERLKAALEPFARKADAVSLSEALGHIEREHLRKACRALEGK